MAVEQVNSRGFKTTRESSGRGWKTLYYVIAYHISRMRQPSHTLLALQYNSVVRVSK